MKRTIIVFFAIAMLCISSCSKENISPTQGQLAASKLKKELGNFPGITSVVIIYNNSGVGWDSFSISDDGFITVSTASPTSTATYNLEQLKYYQVSSSFFNLYF